MDGGTRFGTYHTRIYFIKKTCTCLPLLFPKFESQFAEAEKEVLFSPCDGHIKQAPLLLNICFFSITRAHGEEVLFQTYNKYTRKLQSFRGVDGHQCNCRLRLIVFI